MIDAVIFDMDGTLLNTLDDLTDSVNYTLSQFGFPTHTKDDVRNFVGNGVNLLFERALPQNTDLKIKNQCINFFKKTYSKNMCINTVPYNGILNVLKTIRRNYISTAVLSNKFDDAVKNLSNRYFGDLIDISMGQSETVPQKPSSSGVYKIMRELRAKKAVFVGDSDVDIKTAKNAGIKSIGVTWGFRDRDNLKDADFIVDTPNELLQIIRSL